MIDAKCPHWWQLVVDDPSVSHIVQCLRFLCDSEECEVVLNKIVQKVSKAEILANKYSPEEIELVLHVDCVAETELENRLLVFTMPKEVSDDVPESFSKLLKMSGLAFDLKGHGLYLSSTNDEDWDDWEDWFDEYAPDLKEQKIVPLISMRSDQYIFHPTLKRDNGEPQIVWLAHDGDGYELIPEPHLGAGGVCLRVLHKIVFQLENEHNPWPT